MVASTYDPIGSAVAEERGVDFDVEDLAVALIKFENGATLEVEAPWNFNIGERDLTETRLYGTKGGLVQRNVNEAYEFEAELYVEQNGAHFDMKLHPLGEPVQSATHHLVDSIVIGTLHMATGEEGLLVMEILDAIYRSAEEGQPVRIPNTQR